MKQILIVGAGFFGAVLAERIAEDAGCHVTVIDRRSHIGGNSWSEVDAETGVEYHRYGSHIFHTSSKVVWDYINRFTEFNSYQHTVWTSYQDKVYPMPINLGTICSFFGRRYSPEEAKELVQKEAASAGISQPKNLEEKAISLIGRSLYEAFIAGYTAKQWEKDPTELSADIITRLPVRYTYNNRYFNDSFEGIPLHGYGKMFERLLKHPKIEVRLGTDYSDIAPSLSKDTLVCYTGAIDDFFAYRLGRLEWRTVDLVAERFKVADYQGTSVMNYADRDVPYTRIHEFKHYHPEREDTGSTIIFKEYSRFASKDDEPYYPIDTEANRKLYARYAELAVAEAPQVIFGGRLGQYKYFDMDDTISAALECYKNSIIPKLA